MNCSLFAAALSLAFACASAALAAAPPNDYFVNAITLIGTNATASAVNIDAAKEVGEPNHGANLGGKSVWWTWTAPSSGSVIVETTGSSFDTLLAAYTGASFTVISTVASNDDNGSAATSLIAFNVAPGVTYRIAVDGFNGASGQIQLSLRHRTAPLERPPNDQFEDRMSLAGAFVSVTAANFLASKEPSEPNHADELGGASVWWSWIAPMTGNVTIHTEGSTFDTLLAVYTGSSLTNLSLVTQNDDRAADQSASSVTFHATAQTDYQIAIDGFAGEPGELELRIAMGELFLLSEPLATLAGGWRFTVTTMPGSQVEIEASTNLVVWNPLGTLTNATGVSEFTDPNTARLRWRFYRARSEP